MTRDELVRSAATLAQPDQAVADAFAARRDTLAEALNRAMLARPDAPSLVGPDNLAMMENNHRNHFTYMDSVFRLFDPESFVDTVIWVLRTYRAHGFQVAYWPAMLDTCLGLMEQELEPDVLAQAAPFYRWILVNLPAFTALSESEATPWEDVTGKADHGGGE